MQATTFLRRTTAAVVRSRAPLAGCHPLPRYLSTTYSLGSAPKTDSEEAVAADRGEAGPILHKETVTTTKTVEDKILPAEHHENRPHHPGKSDIEHLDDPTTSEESVHADRHPARTEDLLKHGQGKGKRGFSTNAGVRAGREEEVDPDPQHLEKSGLPHLEKPTLSEEVVHAEKYGEDPLKKGKVKIEKKTKEETNIEFTDGSAPIVITNGGQAVETVLRGSVSNILPLAGQVWLGISC
ncbi:hypothetical protein P7C70_g4625, partial [Phenoliferia sp. Uapishka_3]